MKSIRYERKKEHRRVCHAAQLSIRGGQADRCLLSQSPRPETAVILHFQERMRRAENDLLAHGADFAPQNRIICIGADVSGNSPGSPRWLRPKPATAISESGRLGRPVREYLPYVAEPRCSRRLVESSGTICPGLGEATYEASSHRVAECDHLVRPRSGNARAMCRQGAGGGEVNFLLSTPNPERGVA
jgi:hypothetical protein